jgi:hypothetical protein
MAFPTTSVLDSFNRSNGGLGSNWTNPDYVGNNPPQIISNEWNPQETTGAYSGSYWNVSQFGPNCEVFVTIANTDAATHPDEAFYLIIRGVDMGINNIEGYEIAISGGGYWQITEYGDGSGGHPGSVELANHSQAVSIGDGFGLHIHDEGDGVHVDAYYKPSAGSWGLLFTGIDANNTWTTAGYISCGAKRLVKFDDFGGGNYIGGVSERAFPRGITRGIMRGTI